MDFKKYTEQALKTESADFRSIAERMAHLPEIMRLQHGAIGCATESAELLDAVKKHIFYGKELDAANIKEEVGDLLWYVAIICDVFDFDMQNILDINIAKLAARYPEKFTKDAAINRDLDTERKILEG